MATLHVLSEDVGILPYLNRNGLYPTYLVYTPNDLMQSAAFVDTDTLYLVVIHSFTRFSLAEMLLLFNKLKDVVQFGATVIVMSDIPIKSADLQVPGIEFVRYEGDLFFGRYTWYTRRWRVAKDTEKEDKVAEDISTGKLPEKTKNTSYRQDFWNQFIEFSNPIETRVGALPEREDRLTSSDDQYLDKIITLDIFGTHGGNDSALLSANKGPNLRKQN